MKRYLEMNVIGKTFSKYVCGSLANSTFDSWLLVFFGNDDKDAKQVLNISSVRADLVHLSMLILLCLASSR